MKQYQHPPLEEVTLTDVMHALSDPWRLRIVRQLLISSHGMEFTCGEFPMDICKATRSHHFQVLREAGLVRMRGDGNKCMTSLRQSDIDQRFPGLLRMIAAEGETRPAPREAEGLKAANQRNPADVLV